MVLFTVLRPIIRQLGKYIYQGLRQQDRIIDYTYRKSGLYNRGVVRGIKHGLAGGQIVGGVLSLGLNAPDSPGNENVVSQTRKQYPTRPSYQTRNRFSGRSQPRCPVQQYPDYRTCRSRTTQYRTPSNRYLRMRYWLALKRTSR